jgi:mannopine transport system permease protein
MRSSAGTKAFRLVFGICCALILLYMILPTALVFPISVGGDSYIRFPPRNLSLEWYRAYFEDPEWRAATFFSLKIATLTAISSTVIGTAASLAMARGDFPGRKLLAGLVLAPLVTPHVVLALALYFHFAPLGLVGTTFGFVVAHSVLAVPYVVLMTSAALAGVDPSLEMAALNLGASRWRVVKEITLPLIAPGIAAGALFAFLTSFDETVISFFISGVDHKTITRKIFEDVDFNLTPVIAAVSVVFVVVTIALMVVANMVSRGVKRA